MSKLEELIEQLSPNGVEYKPFGEIATIVRGASPRPIKNFITTDDDGVNWIKIGDVKPGSKYIMETAEKITPEGATKSRLVKNGDFILSNSMSFGRPYIVKNQGCIHDGWLAISDFSDTFISDFLYHLLNSNKYQIMMRQRASFGGAVQNLNADIVKGLELPIIPLPIQEEIVRILDNMTSLTAELTAELKARQKQYEYYRDSLLSFEDKGEQDGVRWMKLGEIARFIYGYTGKAKEQGTARYIRITDIGINGYLNPQDAKYIDLNDENEKYVLQKGNLVMARTGATYGKTLYFDSDTPSVYASFLIKIELSTVLNSRYYWHFSKSNLYWQQANKLVSTAGQPQFNANALANVLVPVPPLKEQQRIVDILDRFDKLCNDISEGLPAEIEARKKQYEYYRDKLLTFKEKEA